MNTAELKPIDARVMKPGDPVVGKDGTTGSFVAYLEEALCDYQAVVFFPKKRRPMTYTHDGRQWKTEDPEVFYPPAPDPIDPSPGNVAKLRRSLVGEGWRIPAHDERPDRRAECWDGAWVPRKSSGPYHIDTTYRVPVAPIQMRDLCVNDFVGKPWPLVRVKGEQAIRAIQGIDVIDIAIACRIAPMQWGDFREQCELSYDHGVTWQAAEKEVGE